MNEGRERNRVDKVEPDQKRQPDYARRTTRSIVLHFGVRVGGGKRMCLETAADNKVARETIIIIIAGNLHIDLSVSKWKR